MSPASILVVEDNVITRKMVRFALENDGFEVVGAADGASALRSFADHDISLVLQDLMLPDLDGYELVRRLRALPRGAEVPILAVSGLLSKLEEARVSSVGFDDVISKPVAPSRLLEIVRAHLPERGGGAEKVGDGRVLVVADDDPVQRKLTSFRLRKLGFEVAEAADGAEALELARALRPAAVVSDVLMPRLDGFGLCVAVRNEHEIAATPLILVTNSYVERADRDLAQRAGASDMVLRTPDLRAVIDALRRSLAGPTEAPAPVELDDDLERERIRRMVRQLERQVMLNNGAARRCALLTAELSVLSGISDALAQQDNVDAALEQVLAACLDAGGISAGALYLTEADGVRVIRFGTANGWPEIELRAFFERTELLAPTAESPSVIQIPSPAVDEAHSSALLRRSGLANALIAPLHHGGATLGALLTGSTSAEPPTEDRVYFAQAVAGQISQALALAHAFAAKDESERAARRQATVLRSILESMADGVVVVDGSGDLIHWNAAASEILGSAPREGPPERWAGEYSLMRADKVTPVPVRELPLVRAMRGESVDSAELFLRRDDVPDGLWLSVNARPLRDDTGEPMGGLAVFRDVTREKAARTQLMVSDRMASIGMLAAGVAHEINNPLTAVVANLGIASHDLDELARDPDRVTDLRALVEEVSDARDAAHRVSQIVRDLKIFSRAEEDRSEAVEVGRVLESSVRMAWNEIRHRARLVKELDDVPAVRANESRLGQVFLNLVVNAAQAIPEGQANRNEIRVAARCAGDDHVVVEIADTGEGMPPEVLDRLFTPFFTTKPPGVGTGLGLAICQRLVTQIGGEITVDSAVGRGSVFRVRLPVMTGDSDDAIETPPVIGAARRGRVLVIDDEPPIARALGRVVARDHEVVTMTSAGEALQRVAGGEHFDVILCDVMMPVMTGMDFYERLTELAPGRLGAIVFLTGGAFTPKAREFLDRVSNARIDKPCDPAELRALVNDRIR